MSNGDHDDDPFSGYALPPPPADAPAPPPAEASAPDTLPPPAAPREKAAFGPPAAFEVEPRKGPARCDDCFHFVPGGALATDMLFELDAAELYDLKIECKEHEKSFELHELRQIAEKAKTLDDRFDKRPRVRGYCAAGQADSDAIYLIAEIKNHDGRCGDFLEGAAPIVACTQCVHRREASSLPPSLTDIGIDFGEMGTNFDPDTWQDHGSGMSSYVGALRSQYDWQEQNYRRRKQEYEQKLRDDVTEAVKNDRPPENGTIDSCRELSSRACAALNRAMRCGHFERRDGYEFRQQGKKMFDAIEGVLDQAFPNRHRRAAQAPAQDRQSKNFRRWLDLQTENSQYAETVGAARKRRLARIMERKTAPLRPEQANIPCFRCAHRRDPVNIDPFENVHFITPEIMNLRADWRNEQMQKKKGEQRACALPSPDLGESEVPSVHIWCDAHSRRQTDGKIQEYAYCYRVLRAKARDGECPSFRPTGE
jgi:hypothetical protein